MRVLGCSGDIDIGGVSTIRFHFLLYVELHIYVTKIIKVDINRNKIKPNEIEFS